MKKIIMISILFVTFGMISSTHALALSIGDAWYVGSINDGIPSNPVNEVDYINNLIDLAAGAGDTDIGSETYNRISSTLNAFNEATVLNSFKSTEEDPSTQWNDVDFMYVLGKYDAGQAGSLVWYNSSGFGDAMITLPGTYNGKGLSHVSFYNTVGDDPGPGPSPVPEPATLFLFGTGLIGLAGIARRRSTKK